MNVELITREDFNALSEEVRSLKEMLRIMSRPQQKEWLTEGEAMEYLSISKSTIQKYRRDGLLNFSQYGNKIYFRQSELEEFLETYFTGSKKRNRRC
jgi:excisionase family DNA binding protein